MTVFTFHDLESAPAILAVAMKTLSNYANHVLESPTDEAFAGEAWSRTA